MASINDVAKLAKVSKSTVSLVINDTGYVSSETREKVIGAIKELNYVPSRLAQNFSKQNSSIIAVVVPDIEHPFFSTLIKHIEKALSKEKYMTIVCSSKGGEEMERRFIEMLNQKMVDGIIMAGHTLDIEEYKKSNRPIVSIDRFINEDIPILHSDFKQAAKMASDLLINAGCKNVVQLVGSQKIGVKSDNFNQLCAGYFMDNKVQSDMLQLNFNSFSGTEYRVAAKRLLEEFPKVDGIIGVDQAVLACMQELQKQGYQVPRDVKLVAYDGTYLTRACATEVTAIVQPIKEIGAEAAKIVLEIINGNHNREQDIIFPVTLQKGTTV